MIFRISCELMTVSVSCLTAVAGGVPASVTFTVKVLPVPFGVPVIAPVAESRNSPVGRMPADRL